MTTTFTQQVSDVLDYDVDMSAWLPAGDTVSDAVAEAEDGITLGETQVTSTKVKQWVSGGTHGERYKVTLTISTTQNRVKQVEFYVKVREA